MSALKSVMTIVKVLRILALIGAILCFIGALISILGASLMFMLPNLADTALIDNIISDYSPDLSVFKIGILVVVAAILSTAQGVVLLFGHIYLRNVEDAGTPFTRDGARELLRLGILTIVIPMVSVAVGGIICLCTGIDDDFSNTVELGIGVGMILLSRFFLYGAELEEKVKSQEV